MLRFYVTVTLFKRGGSNIGWLVRIYFDECFIVNNVNILQVKEKVFVSMLFYKTKQKAESKARNNQYKSYDEYEK